MLHCTTILIQENYTAKEITQKLFEREYYEEK